MIGDCAVDDHDARAGNRPGLSAAQAPRPGPDVSVSVGVAHVFYPEATDAALYGGADARGGPDRPGARPAGRRVDAFALGQYVNDRPYAASSDVDGHDRDIPDRDGWPVRRAAGAGDNAASAEDPLPALPCRGGPRWPAAVRAARLAGRRRQPPAGRSFRSGVTRAMWICAHRQGPAGRCPQSPLRAAAGARRCQALLGQPGRGRQVDPGGWRLAGRSSGKDLDHQPLPARAEQLTRVALARLAEVDDTEPEELDNADEADVEAPSRVPLARTAAGAVLAACGPPGQPGG